MRVSVLSAIVDLYQQTSFGVKGRRVKGVRRRLFSHAVVSRSQWAAPQALESGDACIFLVVLDVPPDRHQARHRGRRALARHTRPLHSRMGHEKKGISSAKAQALSQAGAGGG